MRLLLLLPVIIIHFQSCTQKNETSTEQVNSATADSVQAVRNKTIQIPEDSSLYIGPVTAFEGTSEFYTHVYYRNELPEADHYDYLIRQLDSLVYGNPDDEMKRRRLPLHIAVQYFNLSGLSRISVYNQKGDLITEATLERIELYQDVIESQFVAVFKPVIPSSFTTDVAYGMTSDNAFKSVKLSFSEIKNDQLMAQLTEQFEIDSAKVWQVHQYEVKPYNSIYSVISLENGSLVIETSGDKSTLVHKVESDYSVMEISPVHLEINQKPVWLATLAVNDTDMIWSSLMVYTAHGYEAMQGSRVSRSVASERR